MANETIGQRLLALKERSGLSLPKIAKSGGYRNASSVQRFFSEDYDAEYLPSHVAKKLEKALIGFGEPPIQAVEIFALTEYGCTLDRQFSPFSRTEIDTKAAYQTKIECHRTFLAQEIEIDNETFADCMLVAEDEAVRLFNRPEHLAYRSVDAMFVSSWSMAPRYATGDIVFYEAERPAQIGHDVVVRVNPVGLQVGDHSVAVLAKFVSQTREWVEIETLSPPERIKISSKRVDSIMPVLTPAELLSEAIPVNLT